MEVVQKLKTEIRDSDRLGHLTLSHRVPVSVPGADSSMVFTVDLTLGRDGRFIASCRELPGFVVSGQDEPDTLRTAKQRIWHLLAGDTGFRFP